MFGSDEGRGYRRNVSGNWKQVLIRKYPNKETSWTTSWIHKEERANLVNWNILVTRGKESKSDSLSSGERNGTSLNSIFRGLWDNLSKLLMLGEVFGIIPQRRWRACNQKQKHFFCIPSRKGHVKPLLNLRGPPRKTKYYWITDSEPVPWGKGEKNPGRGVKENMKS